MIPSSIHRTGMGSGLANLAVRMGVVMGVVMGAGPVPVAGQDALPPAEQLTARHVEAIGGRDAVLRPLASRSTGTFEMAAAGLRGELVIVTEAPNRTVTRITLPGMDDMLSGFDGEVGWSLEPMAGPRLLSGGELDVARENANALVAVRDPSLFQSMQTIERAASAGQPCYRVRLVWQSGRETDDCYHVETGLLIESTEEVESPIGMIHVVTTLSDYRDFGGIMFPTRTVLAMMGAEQILTITTVEFEDIDTSVIEPPEEIRVLMPVRVTSGGNLYDGPVHGRTVAMRSVPD